MKPFKEEKDKRTTLNNNGKKTIQTLNQSLPKKDSMNQTNDFYYTMLNRKNLLTP